MNNSSMRDLLRRGLDIYRNRGVRTLAHRASVFFRRRIYRLLSQLQKIACDIEILDLCSEMIVGCIYRIRVQVTNKSRTVWNSSETSACRYAVALRLVERNGVETEGEHVLLPVRFMPGDSWEGPLLIDIPSRIGACDLVVDMVREECYWFSELGVSVPRIPVQVVTHSNEVLARRVPLLDVTMDITNKCPLRCVMCRKTYSESPEDQRDMDWGLFQKIVQEVFPHARSVMLSSAGEPLMTRNFLEAIQLTRKADVNEVSFLTSGMHLDAHRAEKVVEMGVDRVEFSLDGASAEVYNGIRVGSDFDKVIRNIEALGTVKKKLRTHRPLIRFNYVLMKRNIDELPEFIDLAARLGAEEVQCQHMVAFVEALRPEALIYDKERSNHAIQEAKRRAHLRNIRFYHPPLFDVQNTTPQNPDETRSAGGGGGISPSSASGGGIWAEEDSHSFQRKTHVAARDGLQICTDPWRKFSIDWQGVVFPCCMWKEDPIGDLRTQSFQEIWNSQRYGTLRESLVNGALGKSCSECSAITGGDVNDPRSYFF